MRPGGREREKERGRERNRERERKKDGKRERERERETTPSFLRIFIEYPTDRRSLTSNVLSSHGNVTRHN